MKRKSISELKAVSLITPVRILIKLTSKPPFCWVILKFKIRFVFYIYLLQIIWLAQRQNRIICKHTSLHMFQLNYFFFK